jgi:hypothetical protein
MRDPHKPERGYIALTEEEREQLEAAGNPSAVDYARREGPFLVIYWSAPVRSGTGSEPGLFLDLTACLATWKRADREGDR